MEKVDEISAGRKVCRRNNLAQVEGSAARSAADRELVKIFTSVIGGNDDERVDISEHVGKYQIDDSIDVPGVGGFRVEMHASGQKRQGNKEKSVDQVGKEDTGHEIGQRNPLRQGSTVEHHGGEGQGAVGVELAVLQKLRVGFANLLDAQFLVSVGGIIPPLPNGHHSVGTKVLEEHGNFKATKVVQVTLDKIRIRVLSQMVVMQIIMFNIPSLREHPVEPI